MAASNRKAFPKSVSIKGTRYKIKVKKNLADSVDGHPLDGECDSEKKEINLCPEGDRNHSLFHEILHAIIAESGIRSVSFSYELEELIVYNITEEILKLYEVKWKTK
jgi:hypothetical protein